MEADGEEDAKKTMKQLSFPAMDDDALPSSYCQKVLGALAKWRLKLQVLTEHLVLYDDPPDTMNQSFDFH